MKNIMFLGLTLFFALMIKAQPSIVPVEKTAEYVDADIKIPDDTYLKDVNHLLDKFIGTWKGTLNKRNYTFIITQYTDAYNNLLEDKLLMRYLITDQNGTIIEDTRSLANKETYVIEGRFFIKNTTNNYLLTYIGKNAKCGQSGQIHISTSKYIPINPTQMKLNFIPAHIMIDETDCPGFTLAEQIMPAKGGIILTKQ